MRREGEVKWKWERGIRRTQRDEKVQRERANQLRRMAARVWEVVAV